MKQEFGHHVAYVLEAIKFGESGEKEDALPRAIACLAVGVEEKGLEVKIVGCLRSWTYIAAAVCLMELEKSCGYQLLKRMEEFY